MTLLSGASIGAEHDGGFASTDQQLFARQNSLDQGEGSDASAAIIDAKGRHQYIVVLKADAATQYSKSFVPTEVYAAHNKGEIVNLVQSVAADYAIDVILMNSWGVPMFAAFLDDEQLASIQNDRRVAYVEPDKVAKFSADTTAVWSDSATTLASPPNALWNVVVTQASEVQGWGKRAVNQSTVSSNGTTMVYVLDQGVSMHDDLNVVEWTNYNSAYDCGTRTGLSACSSAALNTLVGCSTHATAVAGIVGAKANGTGIIGIDPNVAIVSVSALSAAPDSTHHCNGGTANASTVAAALGWIMSDVVNRPGSRLRVVNMSVNQPSSSLYAQMLAAATPTSSYPGVFIAQSAGNDFQDACSHAYNSSSADGIMVVGAINNHGQPVVPLNGTFGFWKDSVDSDGGGFVHEAGSNFGSCVEVWAPGDAIYSTFGTLAEYQNSGLSSNKYGYGSGTSFAAPHVAGLAAYLLESTLSITPQNLEKVIRQSHLSVLGSHAPQYSAFPPAVNNFHNNTNGLPISLPTMNPVAAPNPKSTTYAELIISNVCGYPKWVTTSPAPLCKLLDYQISGDSELPFNIYKRPATGWAPNRYMLTSALGNPDYIMFDSYGSGNWTCDVSESFGTVGSTVINSGAQYYYDYQFVPSGSPIYSAACPSASINLQ